MTHRLAVLTVSVVFAGSPTLFAQSPSTAEGVAAFVRGDYQRAVEVLQPAAERWVGPPFDDTAALFMAMMYENGIGVAADPVRACALLLRSTMFSSDVLKGTAMALADDLRTRLSPDQLAWCYFLSDIGFDHRFQLARFTLGAGSWVELDLSPQERAVMARIVSFDGEKAAELPLVWTGGMRFMPLRMTEITSLRPSPVRRHFIEVFTWRPLGGNRWTLMWSVSEVARGSLVMVLLEEVLTIEAEQPPADGAIDVTGLARLRVNPLGDAEWVVSSGPEPRSDVIESHLERQELEHLEARRKAADEKVDWSIERHRSRVPSLEYSDASNEGCMGPSIYGWSADRTEAVLIRLSHRLVERTQTANTFALGQSTDVQASVHVHASPQRRWRLCSDARVPDEDLGEQWRAVSGTISIERSPVFRVREPAMFNVTYRVSGAEFVNAAGARVRQSQPIILTTTMRMPR
jgi:hypothetical protein